MRLLIKADRIIDGTGDKPLDVGAVLIEDDRIVAVDRQSEFTTIESEDGVDVIDLPGQSVMPGMFETHAHMHCTSDADAFKNVIADDDETLLLRSAGNVRAALAAGVTTMQDLGSKNDIAFRIRHAIQDGIIPGPRLLVAGTPITTTAGHCHMFGTEADTPDQVVTAVRRQARLGADCIKIMATGGNFTPRSNVKAAQYPADTLRAAVRDAERLGMRVNSHCHGTAGVVNAIEAGVHNLIHCSWLSADPAQTYDYRPELADVIARRGLFVDPTIALGHLRYFAEPHSPAFKPGGAFGSLDARYRILRDMWERGVKFIAGLDAGMREGYFGRHAYVPQVMTEALGISNMAAIECVTRVSAEALGVLATTGTLAPGKLADVIAVDNDPTTDITALHRVTTVLLGGEIIRRDGKLQI